MIENFIKKRWSILPPPPNPLPKNRVHDCFITRLGSEISTIAHVITPGTLPDNLSLERTRHGRRVAVHRLRPRRATQNRESRVTGAGPCVKSTLDVFGTEANASPSAHAAAYPKSASRSERCSISCACTKAAQPRIHRLPLFEVPLGKFAKQIKSKENKNP